MAVLSLALANSPLQTSYINFWQIDFAGRSIVHWVNDGLMSIFFLLTGLELERELYKDELSDIKSAALPIFGALSGMFVPAELFLLLNLVRIHNQVQVFQWQLTLLLL